MLRDKFAMAAMQGIVSDKKQGHTDYGHLAKDAYKIADAMMKERANWDFSGDPELTEFKIIPPQVPTGMLVSDTPIRRIAIPPEVPAPQLDPDFPYHNYKP